MRTALATLATPRPLPSAGPAVSGRAVFVLDDDPVSQLLIDQALSDAGLTNTRVAFTDGTAGLRELLARNADGPSRLPVLVFLDWRMPGCDGIDVLATMRRTPGLERVPVVMLSADDDARQVTQAYELGASSYLVKPLAFSALGAVVRNLALPWQLT